MQTRTATITASLRDVLDRIDRLDKEVAAIDNPLIFFDAALALSEARRHIRAALAATEAEWNVGPGDTRGQRAEEVDV
jgi:hypothetical protein